MEYNKTTKSDLYKIDPRKIDVIEGFNSRVDFALDGLVESIKEEGVLNPISVIEYKTTDGEVRYKLVDGERRYRATMRAIEEGAEIARIPALFLPKSLSEEELLVQQLVRNEGKPFTAYEFSIACSKFQAKGLTKNEIAKRIHKNPGQVTYWLGIQNLKPELKELFKTDKISQSEFHRMEEAHRLPDGSVDEDGILAEINNALKKAKENGKEKEKITLKDLDSTGKTISFRNSKDIKKGLELLVKYFTKYSENGKIEFDLDIMDILEQLTNGRTIDEIFGDCVKQYRKAE